MKAPAFWQSQDSLAARLLSPLGDLYDAISRFRRARAVPFDPGVPVICIGNVTLGGGGKTPLALHAGALLKAEGVNAFFLSRGYGGRRRGPLRVTPHHTAGDVGDEPLLLAEILPTVVAADRAAGAAFAVAQGAQALIMDDGFQNPSLAKTLSILAIDGQYRFGNGRLFPAGPLRERVENAAARAQAAVIIDGDGPLPGPPLPILSCPVFTVGMQPAGRLASPRYVAFCGLARPEKFFALLKRMGVEVAETVSYPDHYPYRRRDVQRLLALAKHHDAALVTTAKDAARLDPPLRAQVEVLPVALAFDDAPGFRRLLLGALA